MEWKWIADMTKRLAKCETRYLGMSPRGEIACPHGRPNLADGQKFRCRFAASSILPPTLERAAPSWGLIRPARKERFIKPDQSDASSPVPFAKIFRFTRRANHLYKFAPSHPTRGAYHDRHGRGVGCGGRGSVLRAKGCRAGFTACERSQSERTRDVVAYGEVVWS